MDLRRFFTYSLIAIGAAFLSVGIQAFAFTQPASAPPTGDAYAPIDTGSAAQAKTGGLLLNTGGAANGLIVQYGKVGIGTVSPGMALEVAGTIKAGTTPNPTWGDIIGGSLNTNTVYAYGNVCVGNSSGYCGGTGGVVISSSGVKFPDGTVQSSAAANPVGSYLPLAGGVMNGGGTRIGINGSTISSTGGYGFGNGAAYNNPNSLAVDTLETDGGTGGGGTLELNYYGGGAVTIGPSGTKPLYTSIIYDGNNTGYYLDPSYVSYINALQVAGGSLLSNWPGYPRGIQQTDGAYVYPGFVSGQGAGWNTSYYLAGSTSWGLYTNTSFYSAGGIYDRGNLVYSAANPPTSVTNSTNSTNATYATYINTDSYNMKLHWSGQPGQPTWLWGSNNGADSYVWNPSNFSVNYANSAGSAGSATNFNNGSSYSSGGNLYTTILYDSNNTGYYVDPNGNTNINALQTNNTLAGWPGYNGVAQAYGHYIWPGRNDGSGVSWQQSWYLASNSSYGLYTNTGLYAAGAIYTSGAMYAPAFYYWSDESLKKNITTIPDALQSVLALRGVEFNWKKDGRPDIGVIAQEVEKVYPQLVTTDAKTGLKSVENGNLVGPLIEAIKELAGKVQDIVAAIGALKDELLTHETQIHDLQTKVAEQQKSIDALELQVKELMSR